MMTADHSGEVETVVRYAEWLRHLIGGAIDHDVDCRYNQTSHDCTCDYFREIAICRALADLCERVGTNRYRGPLAVAVQCVAVHEKGEPTGFEPSLYLRELDGVLAAIQAGYREGR